MGKQLTGSLLGNLDRMLHTSSFLVSKNRVVIHLKSASTDCEFNLLQQLKNQLKMLLTKAFPLLEGHHLHGFLKRSHVCLLLGVVCGDQR